MSPQSPSILSQLPSEGALNQTKILKEKIHLLVISDEEEMMKLERRETSKYDACTSANSSKCLRTQ